MKPVRTTRGGMAAGFTLAEALLAVVLLGIAASSILMPFTAGAILRKEGSARTLASNLASEQMEKVLRTPATDIIATWNDYTEDAGELTDSSGNTLSGSAYSAFARTTTCSHVRVGQQSGLVAPSLIHVTVDVSYRGVSLVKLNRLVAE